MTLHDWIYTIDDIWPIAVGIVGVLWGWYERRYGLPKQAKAFLKRLADAGVSIYSITCMLNTASAMADKTNAEKQAWVRIKLQEIAKGADIDVPDAVANLIIEWVYNRLKAKP